MTIFHSIDKVGSVRCLVNPDRECEGEKCMAWMYKQDQEGERKITNTGYGICGWLYAMAYFRDKNSNPYL